jgi:cathepsin L
MFSKAIALSLLAASATATGNLSVDKVTFASFIKQFHPTVSEGSAEWTKRQQIFEESVTEIRTHNAKKGLYKMGLNKFSASTAEEKKVVLGRRGDMERAHTPKKLIEEHSFDMKPVSELPTHVDWREKGCATATKDQGHCGSCFAFAAAAMLEDYLYMSSGLMYDLSPQMAASCTPNPEHCGGSGGCNGGTAEIVFDHLANGGGKMSQEYMYGYRSYFGEDFACQVDDIPATLTVGGLTMLQGNNYTEMMNAVAQVGPVSIGVDASEWHNYESGVFNGCNQKNPDVNHAVVLYGYGVDESSGEQYWLVRNSCECKFYVPCIVSS